MLERGCQMAVDFDPYSNRHTIAGALATLRLLLPTTSPKSLLDVGCGIGTWLTAAMQIGISDVTGIDGLDLPQEELAAPKNLILTRDLTEPFDLGRTSDLAICLEVGEHLPHTAANTLISCITKHAHTVLFSAACPGQSGQHHVNCQWPAYWQLYFNQCGFVCDDSARWQIWSNENIEPWYRQNLFWARRNPELAYNEPRLRAVVHPDIAGDVGSGYLMREIENGSRPLSWYATLPFRAMAGKLTRSRSRIAAKITSRPEQRQG
jgi:SAM-dependent methyltransferase